MIQDRSKKLYDKELKKVERKISNLLKGRKPKSLYDPCAYIIKSGGKRIRPLLVILSAMAIKKSSNVYNAAISVELFHNFTLAHDDIMDKANIRRGKPTLHKKYDTNTAILAGDNLIGLAYKNLLKDCGSNSKKIVDTFTQGIIEVCEGQSYDETFELRKNVSIKEYKLMIKKKTAALLEMCCSIGAQLAGGSEKQIAALSSFGRNLGMAFQIQDDLLDIIGDEKDFGKNVGGDLVEGKKTYIFLKALEKAKGKDKQALQKVILNKGIKKPEVNTYREIYFKLGVIKDAQSEVKQYSRKALRALDSIKQSDAKETLLWLTNVLIKRIK